jgi:hypothetical protein
MTLEYLVANIDEFDEELVIFQKDELSIDSEVILFERDEDDTVRIKDGIKYVYFLEFFIAKEFIEDWVSRSNFKPNVKEIALRLLQYAIYDA